MNNFNLLNVIVFLAIVTFFVTLVASGVWLWIEDDEGDAKSWKVTTILSFVLFVIFGSLAVGMSK